MLDVLLFEPFEIENTATCFHRDGFVVIKDALSPEQLKLAQEGARRVIKEQTQVIALEDANRGFARYSFGNQIHHAEWQMLIDLPTVIPILDAIWSSREYSCMGGGGDYSLPGAKIQPLHSDIDDFFHDPLKQVTFQDIPAPFIVVNFLMTAFTKENGAIRFIPCTQRSRHPIPSLDEEPEWMQNSILCAPAGTAVIRDVRCWHAGTTNASDMIRPMISVGYFAPWFRRPVERILPRPDFERLSQRAQQLCQDIVAE